MDDDDIDETHFIDCAGEAFSLRNLVVTRPAQDTLQNVFEVLMKLAEDISNNASDINELKRDVARLPAIEHKVEVMEKQIHKSQIRVTAVEDALSGYGKRIALLEKDVREKDEVFKSLKIAVKDFQATKVVVKADLKQVQEQVVSTSVVVDTLERDAKALTQQFYTETSELRHSSEQLRFDLRGFESSLPATLQEKVDAAMAYWEKQTGGKCKGCTRLEVCVDDVGALARETKRKLDELGPIQASTDALMEQASHLSSEVDLMQKNWIWSFAQEARAVRTVKEDFQKKLDNITSNPNFVGSGAGVAERGGRYLENGEGGGGGGLVGHKQSQDTLGMAPGVRFAEVVRVLEEHTKELQRLEDNKADARAVWAEFRKRPDHRSVAVAIQDATPAVEEKVAKAVQDRAESNLRESLESVHKVAAELEALGQEMSLKVNVNDLETILKEWSASLHQGPRPPSGNCEWCQRPLVASSPEEKSCQCSLRPGSRAPSDTSLYGSDGNPYRSDVFTPPPTASRLQSSGRLPKSTKRPKTSMAVHSVPTVPTVEGPRAQSACSPTRPGSSQGAMMTSSGRVIAGDGSTIMAVQYMTLGGQISGRTQSR